MQSSRVWQTRYRDGGVAPSEELPTINYDRVRDSITRLAGAVPPPPTGIDPAGIAPLVREAMAPKAPEYVPEASQWLPQELRPQRRLKMASISPAALGICQEPGCGLPHPCSHDIQRAQQAGDFAAVRAMNEVRNSRRFALAKAREEALAAAAEIQESFVREAAARKDRRTQVAQVLDEMEKEASGEVEAGKGGCKCKDGCVCEGGECMCKNGCKCACTSDTKGEGFKSMASLSDAERDRLSKWASKHGWAPEYAEKFFVKASPEVPDFVRKIGANAALDEGAKKDLIIAMCKEAKLTSEQASRIKEYWGSELGYQDKDWVTDLVADPAK